MTFNMLLSPKIWRQKKLEGDEAIAALNLLVDELCWKVLPMRNKVRAMQLFSLCVIYVRNTLGIESASAWLF